MPFPRNLKLRVALKIAETRFGCDVHWPSSTGEVLVWHRPLGRRLRLNGRRVDAPICLVSLLNRLEKST